MASKELSSLEVDEIVLSKGQSIIEQLIDQNMGSEATHEDESAAIEDSPLEGLLIGTIDGFDSAGLPTVVVNASSKPFTANYICGLDMLYEGAQCAVMFSSDESSIPVILGVLQQSVIVVDSPEKVSLTTTPERIEIHSEGEISLRCGSAQLRMTADGLVELRGRKVVSHSTGLNRVRGASVKLN